MIVLLLLCIFMLQDADGVHFTEAWPEWRRNETVQSGYETAVRKSFIGAGR